MSSLARTMVLPDEYWILPDRMPMWAPGFSPTLSEQQWSLVPQNTTPSKLFDSFLERVVTAKGTRYLPVGRMSDGEYRLLFGYQPPSRRLSCHGKMLHRVREFKRFARSPLVERAATMPGVSSGAYRRHELARVRSDMSIGAKHVARHGFLALHLTWGRRPFQEHYHPALGRWLAKNDIYLTLENFVPFYFVYALLSGPKRQAIYRDSRILVVHSAEGRKRDAITKRLLHEGSESVTWLSISPTRSAFDFLDFSPYVGAVDLVLLGAGLGKFEHLARASILGVPCIDAGFMFEVWNRPECGRLRPYCEWGPTP